jgi:hypothetical protein
MSAQSQSRAPSPYLHRLPITFSLSLGLAIALLAAALLIGVAGYHFIARLSWVDALLNASMILTGMGPVAILTSTSAKIFASLYALFSGVVFLSATGVIMAPVVHRVLHRFHLERGKS